MTTNTSQPTRNAPSTVGQGGILDFSTIFNIWKTAHYPPTDPDCSASFRDLTIEAAAAQCIADTVTRAKLEALWEMEMLASSSSPRSVAQLRRMLTLSKGTPANVCQRAPMRTVHDVFLLKTRVEACLESRKVEPWSVCGQFMRKVVCMIQTTTFNDLSLLLKPGEAVSGCVSTSQNPVDLCRLNFMSEHHLMHELEKAVFSLENSIKPTSFQVGDLRDNLVVKSLNKLKNPTFLILKILRYLKCKDELGVQRSLHKYFDYICSLPGAKNTHHLGLIALSSVLLRLGRRKEATRVLREVLCRRPIAIPSLLNLMFNLMADWEAMENLVKTAAIFSPEFLSVVDPAKDDDNSSIEVPESPYFRQLATSLLVDSQDSHSVLVFASQLCAHFHPMAEKIMLEKFTSHSVSSMFDEALRDRDWKMALKLCERLQPYNIARALTVLARADNLSEIPALLKSNPRQNYQKKQVSLIKAILKKRMGHTPTYLEDDDDPQCWLQALEWLKSPPQYLCVVRQKLLLVHACVSKPLKIRCLYVWGRTLAMSSDSAWFRQSVYFLKRASDGFQEIGDTIYNARACYMLARVADHLHMVELRNKYARKFRRLVEQLTDSDIDTLFY